MKKLIVILLSLALLAPAGLAFAEETDTQNPVMNYIGDYVDMATYQALLSISCSGETDAYVEIETADEATGLTRWTFTGPLDPETGVITYENCVKAGISYDDSGEIADVIYEDGTGCLTIGEDDAITWTDDKEDAGNGFVFTYLSIDAENDWQNPVMNLVGDYMDRVSQRAGMTVECSGETDAYVEIFWANDASELVLWVFTGTFDTETNTIPYTGCVKSVLTYAEDGTETEEVVYEDGVGTLTVGEDGIIYWANETEPDLPACEFEYFGYTVNEEAEEYDFQNPVMNLVGMYEDETSQRAVMVVECSGEIEADVQILWSSDAAECTTWTFTGQYFAEAGEIYYNNCVKAVSTFDENGNETEEILYEDGTGTLTIGEDNTILWKDDKEDAGVDCRFVFCAAPDEELVEADAQNPVMNLIGSYADKTSQRASMVIECEGQSGAKVEISWANSAFETVLWEFTGAFNAEDNTIVYDNCVCSTLTYDEDNFETAILNYADGTGKLVVGEDWTITWVDDKEDAGKDCVFVFSAE